MQKEQEKIIIIETQKNQATIIGVEEAENKAMEIRQQIQIYENKIYLKQT